MAGRNHHFKFVQVPFSMLSFDALVIDTSQKYGDFTKKRGSLFEVCESLGINVLTYKPLEHGRLDKSFVDVKGIPVKSTYGKYLQVYRSLMASNKYPNWAGMAFGATKLGNIEANLSLLP